MSARRLLALGVSSALTGSLGGCESIIGADFGPREFDATGGANATTTSGVTASTSSSTSTSSSAQGGDSTSSSTSSAQGGGGSTAETTTSTTSSGGGACGSPFASIALAEAPLDVRHVGHASRGCDGSVVVGLRSDPASAGGPRDLVAGVVDAAGVRNGASTLLARFTGGGNSPLPGGLLVTPQDELVVTGAFNGTMNDASSDGNFDGFLVASKLDAAGGVAVPSQILRVIGPEFQRISGVAHSEGQLFATGPVSGVAQVQVGQGLPPVAVIDSFDSSSGARGGFLFRVSNLVTAPNVEVLATFYPSTNSTSLEPRFVAANVDHVAVVGQYKGSSFNLVSNNPVRIEHASADRAAGFVMLHDRATDFGKWIVGFGSTGASEVDADFEPRSVAFSPTGAVLVGGTARGTATKYGPNGDSRFEHPGPSGGGRPRGFVVRINAVTNALEDVAIASGTGLVQVHQIAPTPAGDVYVAGVFESTVAMGACSTSRTAPGASGTTSVFVMRLDAKLDCLAVAEIASEFPPEPFFELSYPFFINPVWLTADDDSVQASVTTSGPVTTFGGLAHMDSGELVTTLVRAPKLP